MLPNPSVLRENHNSKKNPPFMSACGKYPLERRTSNAPLKKGGVGVDQNVPHKIEKRCIYYN